jgi:DNA-binding NtrC family response regulator
MPPIELPRTSLELVVVEGPDAGRSIPVDERRLVGTSDRCDLVLADPTVSRRHLSAEPSELGVRIRDEGSRNGTWIDRVRVHDAELAPGDELRLGQSRLRLEEAVGGEASEDEPEAGPARTAFGRFVGAAPALAPMYRTLELAAPTETTVLLEGESGVGKELLAEAIHEHSRRADGPFVVVDCGALPESLIESELFGYEKGAFTGAHKARAGAFESANGGTIFLDEIGELPLAMQTRLLRVLDRREVQRLGSSQRRRVDVRVVAATNRNLEREVERSRFRLDLFHRLAVVLVRVPPLREREGDVERLAAHLARTLAGPDAAIGEEALARMREHDWPGNVRELRNYVERHLLLGDLVLGDPALGPAAAPAAPPSGIEQLARSGLPYRQARAQALAAFSRMYTDDMLRRHDGNVSRAARAAGVARRHFQRLKAEPPAAGAARERGP